MLRKVVGVLVLDPRKTKIFLIYSMTEHHTKKAKIYWGLSKSTMDTKQTFNQSTIQETIAQMEIRIDN